MARGCTPSSCSHADRSSFRARRRKARHVVSSGELFATRACGRGMMHRVRGRVACDARLRADCLRRRACVRIYRLLASVRKRFVASR